MVELSLLQSALVVATIAVGVFFLGVGTLGLVRLPDVYNRMHATSKATTLGTSSILLGVMAYHGPKGAGLVAVVAVVFLFVTAPTGAHLMSRAAQRMGVEFAAGARWPGHWDDEPEEPAEGDD